MDGGNVLAIGVDGGASGVRALAVRRRADGLLEAAGEVARRDHGAFEAVTMDVQRVEVLRPDLDDAEAAAAHERVRTTADAIVDAAGGSTRIALAVCWPGLKSADGRGVTVMRNGPRDPGLLDDLERELAARGVVLARPIPRLASDGVTGALGECRAVAGGMRDVANALYLAGGSGLAEALLVAGRVRALDELTPPVPKAFELRIPPSLAALARLDHALTVYEDLLSPGRWSPSNSPGPRETGVTSADLNRMQSPGVGRGHVDRALAIDWTEAIRRDPERVNGVLRVAADALVRYIEDRMQRLRESVGVVPERAVVGARLGQLIAMPEARGMLRDRIVERLRVAGLPADFVRASTLLEAPAFGAAALALGLENVACPS